MATIPELDLTKSPEWNNWNLNRNVIVDALNNAYLQNGVTNAVPYGSPPEDNEAWAAGQRAKMADYVAKLPKPSTFAGSGGGTFTGSSGEKTIVPQAGAQNINFWRNNPSGASPAAVESYKQQILPSQWLTKQVPAPGPVQGTQTEAATWRDMLQHIPEMSDSVGPGLAGAIITGGQTTENNQKALQAQYDAKLEGDKAQFIADWIKNNGKPLNQLQQFELDQKQTEKQRFENYIDSLMQSGVTSGNYNDWLLREAKNEEATGSPSALFATAKTYGSNYGDSFKAMVAQALADRERQTQKNWSPSISDVTQRITNTVGALFQPSQKTQPASQPSQTPTPQPTQAAGPTETTRVLPVQAPQAQTQQPQAFSLDTGKVNLVRQLAAGKHPFDPKALAAIGWTPQQIEKGQMQYQGLLNRGGK